MGMGSDSSDLVMSYCKQQLPCLVSVSCYYLLVPLGCHRFLWFFSKEE